MITNEPLDCIGIKLDGLFRISSARQKYIMNYWLSYPNRICVASLGSNCIDKLVNLYMISLFGNMGGRKFSEVIVIFRLQQVRFKIVSGHFTLNIVCQHVITLSLTDYECWNGTLTSIIKTYVKRYNQWSNFVNASVWTYNTSAHSITRWTLYALFYGCTA